MIPTAIKSYDNEGDIRIGWASWDKGTYTQRSIKYAYLDKNGKISRGSPEVSFNTLIEMVIFAYQQGEFSKEEVEKLKKLFCGKDNNE
jgi:hypothetical protein